MSTRQKIVGIIVFVCSVMFGISGNAISQDIGDDVLVEKILEEYLKVVNDLPEEKQEAVRTFLEENGVTFDVFEILKFQKNRMRIL